MMTGSALVRNDAPDTIFSNVDGWKTRARGQVTLPRGTTSVKVVHGLAVTPELDEIRLSPITGWSGASSFWVSSPGAANFSITVTATPTTGDQDGNTVNLPVGNYTNFIDLESPSALVSPITVTVGLAVTAPGRAVRLGAALGTQAAGSEVCLADVQGGCVNPAHEPFCAYAHMHGAAGITITGLSGGPFPDPAQNACGFGEVFTKPGCGADTLPSCN